MPDDTNGIKDIFIFDGLERQTSRVSITEDGLQVNESSYSPAISADGRYVVYEREGQIYIINFEKANRDIYPPTSTIDNLPDFTNSRTIPLSWAGIDSISPLGTRGVLDHFDVQVKVGETGEWQDVITNTQVTSYTYAAQTDGWHAFRVRAVDTVGNVEAWPDAYDTATTIDQTSPTGAIAINYNPASGQAADYTTSRDVALWLSASDNASGVTGLRLSADGIAFGPWQSFAETTTTLLDGLFGVQTVAAQFRDAVGNVSAVYSSTIVLDSRLGTEYGLSINDGDLFTNQTAVSLTLTAVAYTAEMQVSNDGGFQGIPWQPFSLYKPWQITSFGNSPIPRTVYVRFRDTEGRSSVVYQDDIILDLNAPTSKVTALVLESRRSAPLSLDVAWSGQDDISGVKWYDIQVQVDGGPWQDWLTQTAGQEGTYPVLPGHRYGFRTRAQDNAGNWEADWSASKSIAIPGHENSSIYLPFLYR